MYSFDIFDTLITRCTISPQGVFLVMKSWLQKKRSEIDAINYIADNFEFLRIEAEQNVDRDLRKVICLEDIYRTLAQMVDVDYESIKYLELLEIKAETDCSVAIKKNIQKIKELVRRGEHVVLISDMYLPEKAIRKMLTRIDSIFEEIPIYISSEYGCTKESGLLYIKVREREKASYKNWTHCGDNYVSDICVPELLGIKTVRRPLPEMLLCEKEVMRQFPLEHDLSLQLILGASRNLRLQNRLDYTGEIGVSLGGAIFFPYVTWVIEQSIKNGIDRLYFIARDGYILKRIADIYIKQKKLKLQTIYIYGSRTAWRVDEDSKKELVRNYLCQEIDFSDDRFAFVDLQGTGRSMGYLATLLKDYIKGKLKIFYYNMVRRAMDIRCSYIVYSTSKLYLVESLCRAPHGTTLGYQKFNNRYVPILADVDAQKWIACGLKNYIHGIELFTEEICQIGFKLGCNITVDTLGKFFLEYCYNTPDTMVADFIGEIPHSTLDLNDKKKYAPKLSKKEIFQIFMWRTNESLGKYYDGENLEYSMLRTDPKEKRLIAFYEKNYNKLFGKIIHSYKRVKGGDHYKWNSPSIKKVIIYAAGTAGKELYEKLRHTWGVKVVGWTDMDYEKYQNLGYPVEPLKKLLDLKYDILVIAIKNREKSENAKQLLIESGIDSGHIMQRDEFYEKCL